MRTLTVTPDFKPPETLAKHLKPRIDPFLDEYTHIAIVDKDIHVPEEFYNLPEQYPSADIIGVDIRPSSRWHRMWEQTYRIRIGQRIRGGAVIYSTEFLKQVGGWPLVMTPDSWLLQRATNAVRSNIRVTHFQPLSFRHSVNIQIRDGRSRAQLKYPLWRTIFHSIFRLRPLVFAGYAFERWGRHWHGIGMVFLPAATVGLLVQRIVFTLLGWYDVETQPAIIEGLKHPYQVVWQAPYGVLWYAINEPLTWLQIPILSAAQSWLFWTSLIDMLIIWYLFRKTFWSTSKLSRLITPMYVVLSVLTWRQAPYNLSILWLTGLGLSHWGFLALAVIAKLPVGAPLETWNFALHGTGVLTNWRYYGILMFFWLLIVYRVWNLRRERWMVLVSPSARA